MFIYLCGFKLKILQNRNQTNFINYYIFIYYTYKYIYIEKQKKYNLITLRLVRDCFSAFIIILKPKS